ncbi:unnamed protein product, partial [marine sediment metagenome]
MFSAAKSWGPNAMKAVTGKSKGGRPRTRDPVAPSPKALVERACEQLGIDARPEAKLLAGDLISGRVVLPPRHLIEQAWE